MARMPWFIDSVGAYLALRECHIERIDPAVRELCATRTPTPVEFDAIADGLTLYRDELSERATGGVTLSEAEAREGRAPLDVITRALEAAST